MFFQHPPRSTVQPMLKPLKHRPYIYCSMEHCKKHPNTLDSRYFDIPVPHKGVTNDATAS